MFCGQACTGFANHGGPSRCSFLLERSSGFIPREMRSAGLSSDRTNVSYPLGDDLRFSVPGRNLLSQPIVQEVMQPEVRVVAARFSLVEPPLIWHRVV